MKQGIKHTIKTNNPYFLTMTVVGWADVFSRENHKKIIIESLKYCQEHKGLVVFAYVIMTNHIHMLVNTNEPFLLHDSIRDFKKFTSKKIVDQIQNEPESRRTWMLSLFAGGAAKSKKHKDFKFWQVGNHAIEVYSQKFAWDKINYIHQNPVKAGLVKQPEDWLYSSAANYAWREQMLEVKILMPRLILYRQRA